MIQLFLFYKNLKLQKLKGGSDVDNYIRHIRGHRIHPLEIKIIIIFNYFNLGFKIDYELMKIYLCFIKIKIVEVKGAWKWSIMLDILGDFQAPFGD